MGEAPGGRPNHFGDPGFNMLEGSALPFLASTLLWQDSDPNDVRQAVYPDLPVAERFADWVMGRDAALEAALMHEVEAGKITPPIQRWKRESQQEAK